MRDSITAHKKKLLRPEFILLDEFSISASSMNRHVDDKKDAEGKSVKRAVRLGDIEALKPFHWGFEFDEIVNQKGGFDAIITNPRGKSFRPMRRSSFRNMRQPLRRRTEDRRLGETAKGVNARPRNPEAWLQYASTTRTSGPGSRSPLSTVIKLSKWTARPLVISPTLTACS